ncbi:CNNM domain-containing protein, partial [Georgenia sp. 10Sc9-8]|nr:CNNM domain-containing protein [Georgenia halotolerans]
MLTEWLMIALGVLLTAGTAVFVAAEFSLVALDPGTVDRRVAAGDKRAAGVGRALQHLSTELSGAQVGITVTTVLLGYTTQSALATL